MEITRIIAEIKKERPDAKAVFFVGMQVHPKAETVSCQVLFGREGVKCSEPSLSQQMSLYTPRRQL